MQVKGEKPDANAIPEGVVLASPWVRLGGQCIDGIIAFGLGFGAGYAVYATGRDGAVVSLTGLFFYLAYFLLSDGLPGGQSIAKRLLGIRVIDIRTQASCGYWQSFCRNSTQIFGLLDWIFICFKGWRRAGDYFADTIVVNK